MSDICNACSDRGQCCTYVELPLSRILTSDEKRWVELHPGLSIKQGHAGAPAVRIEVRCSALTDSGFCALYGTPQRPQMCADWPDQPEQQAPPGCAYLTLRGDGHAS